jgi:hypothetical protein
MILSRYQRKILCKKEMPAPFGEEKFNLIYIYIVGLGLNPLDEIELFLLVGLMCEVPCPFLPLPKT